MKLLYCIRCNDVKKLDYETRHCKCGDSYGKYLRDGWHAEVGGSGILIGLNNVELAIALGLRVRHPDTSHPVGAFLIPDSSERVKRLNETS